MRRRGLGSLLIGLGAGLALLFALDTRVVDHARSTLFQWLAQQAYDTPHSWLGEAAWHSLYRLYAFLNDVRGLLPVLLIAGSLAALAGVVARSVAWARVREGKADPLDRLRSRPRLLRILTAGPAALLATFGALMVAGTIHAEGMDPSIVVSHLLHHALEGLIEFGAIAGLVYAATRVAVRTLLAPLEVETSPPKDDREIVFSAVAVSARAVGAVGALALAPVALMAWVLLGGANNPAFPVAFTAYIATALTAPFVLRSASRIAVGIDGVWVRDTSTTRFFAYRDLDAARARGADLELVRGGSSVLRLQMHGEDAGRRDEVQTRINERIERSRDASNRGAELVVQAMPASFVMASSAGVEGYRTPSVSREQLWELVEASTTDARTRTAAAQALAHMLEAPERSRLRVAAARCAEPRVRVELEQLASHDEVEEESQVTANGARATQDA